AGIDAVGQDGPAPQDLAGPVFHVRGNEQRHVRYALQHVQLGGNLVGRTDRDDHAADLLVGHPAPGPLEAATVLGHVITGDARHDELSYFLTQAHACQRGMDPVARGQWLLHGWRRPRHWLTRHGPSVTRRGHAGREAHHGKNTEAGLHRLLQHGGRDPAQQRAAFVTNERGSVYRMKQARGWQYGAALLLAVLGCTAATDDDPAAAAAVQTNARPGIDRLIEQGAGALTGLRVGLITNHTGTTADGSRSTIDVLHEHPDLELVALFSPEHGIRGAVEAGEHVASGRDEQTGLPIHSLYGETRVPTGAMLDGLDALVFDIQDIGTRYYTYVWTMAHALEAAAEHDKLFVVLDRPNPIGGDVVQGNVLDTAYASFVGLYPVPMRHGMTA